MLPTIKIFQMFDSIICVMYYANWIRYFYAEQAKSDLIQANLIQHGSIMYEQFSQT